jgi:hypothetical protein
MALPDPVWVNDAPPRVDRRQVGTGRQEPLAAQSGPPWSMRTSDLRGLGTPRLAEAIHRTPSRPPRQPVAIPASRLQDLGLRPTRKPEEPLIYWTAARVIPLPDLIDHGWGTSFGGCAVSVYPVVEHFRSGLKGLNIPAGLGLKSHTCRS